MSGSATASSIRSSRDASHLARREHARPSLHHQHRVAQPVRPGGDDDEIEPLVAAQAQQRDRRAEVLAWHRAARHARLPAGERAVRACAQPVRPPRMIVTAPSSSSSPGAPMAMSAKRSPSTSPASSVQPNSLPGSSVPGTRAVACVIVSGSRAGPRLRPSQSRTSPPPPSSSTLSPWTTSPRPSPFTSATAIAVVPPGAPSGRQRVGPFGLPRQYEP